jgi:hypothetical protein
MKRLIHHFLLLTMAFAPAHGAEPTQDDYDIWNAVLRGWAGYHESIYVWHTIEPLSAFQRISVEKAIGQFPEARPKASVWEAEAVELDIDRLNSARTRNPQGFDTYSPPRPYVLLEEQELVKAAGKTPKGNWLMHTILLPEARAVVRLSRPVIREDGRVAFLVLLFSTEWWGSVMFCQAGKDPPLSGKWRGGMVARADYTDWSDGQFVYEGEKRLYRGQLLSPRP